MNQEPKSAPLPSDALAKPARRAPWIIGGAAAIAIAVSAVVAGPTIAAQLNPAPTATSAAVVADEPAPLTDAELAAVQQGADAQQAQIEADAAAALLAQQQAEAAAAQAAAEAAKRSVAENPASHGLIVCPAGSVVVEGDAQGNADLCLPSICQHLSLPDPDHPECVTAFKP